MGMVILAMCERNGIYRDQRMYNKIKFKALHIVAVLFLDIVIFTKIFTKKIVAGALHVISSGGENEWM